MNKKIVKKHVFLICVLALYVFIVYITGIGCPLRYVTGIPCPTCGMTRAYLSFLSFDFKTAFYFHPLFLLAFPFALLLVHFNLDTFLHMKRKPRNTILILMLILFWVVYAVRLLFFTIP